jgi:hypothetical protein
MPPITSGVTGTSVHQVAGYIGAEITGADIGGPLSQAAMDGRAAGSAAGASGSHARVGSRSARRAGEAGPCAQAGRS